MFLILVSNSLRYLEVSCIPRILSTVGIRTDSFRVCIRSTVYEKIHRILGIWYRYRDVLFHSGLSANTDSEIRWKYYLNPRIPNICTVEIHSVYSRYMNIFIPHVVSIPVHSVLIRRTGKKLRRYLEKLLTSQLLKGHYFKQCSKNELPTVPIRPTVNRNKQLVCSGLTKKKLFPYILIIEE
jgi:hypothetical protein